MIACFVCDIVVWRAESFLPQTDGTAMVFVCEGWCGVAGQVEGRGAAFPARNLLLLCVVLLLAFPLTLPSCVPAWSGRMLTGHVDCECLLTASTHLSPPLCLSFPVVFDVLHRVRAGPHTPTARRDLPCCCSFLCAMALRAVSYGLSPTLSAWVLCSAPH
ncbi:trans-sialidase [Trypanosoma cruzi cruzi]|nr:trans-sialidase [Trypanosoma cruzi cruzi]